MVAPAPGMERIATGARGILQWHTDTGTYEFALCAGIEVFRGITYAPIATIGRLPLAAHAPVEYIVTARADLFVIVGDPLSSSAKRLFPEFGKDENAFLRNVLGTPASELHIFDQYENVPQTVLKGVRVATDSKSWRQGQVSMNNVDFVVISQHEYRTGNTSPAQYEQG